MFGKTLIVAGAAAVLLGSGAPSARADAPSLEAIVNTVIAGFKDLEKQVPGALDRAKKAAAAAMSACGNMKLGAGLGNCLSIKLVKALGDVYLSATRPLKAIADAAKKAWDATKAAAQKTINQVKMSLGIGVKPGGPVAAVPAVGAKAPDFPLPMAGKARVILFSRHVGCPCGEYVAKTFRQSAMANPNIEYVFVSHVAKPETDAWTNKYVGAWPANVKVVIDESRALYAAWGLGLSDPDYFIGPRALVAIVRLALQGIHNRLPEYGTRFQKGGEFGLDAQGNIRWRHIPTFCGDYANFGAAATALRGGV
jgi:hypothetical protein